MKTNGLSALGRMSYAAHLGLYPVVGGTAFFLISNWSKHSAQKERQAAIDALPKDRAVDPDDFQPFSAVPFHNNTESRYRYADLKMHNYLRKDNQMNMKDYFFKGFYNSYDHDN